MSQNFNTSDVSHIAQLASLILDSSELDKFAPQLSVILQFISKLQIVNTSAVAPTSQVTGLVNVYREDKVDESRMLSQKQALANAKETYKGFFKVPAILGKK